MSLKGFLFISIFFICVAGSLLYPCLGIYGYLADYCIAPSGQWWGRPFSSMGFRFSLILAMSTVIGFILQNKKLKFGKVLLYNQEITLLIFLIIVWTIHYLSPQTLGRYGAIDHPTVKFTKIVIFVLLMTHIITDLQKIRWLFIVFSAITLVLGTKAWSIPYSSFSRGRLEGIGGADFSEANFFAAFLAAMLPLIGIMFLRSNWRGKLYYLITGAFTANAVVLCRSRGAFLGLAMGALTACWYAPKRYRKQIFILIFIGIVGVVYLSDEFFIDRIMTISTEQSEMDASSSSRIRLWNAGLQMVSSHPLGIGPGNWYQNIEYYIPEYVGKDSHSTYVKCLAELGVIGMAVFLLLLLQSYLNLVKVYKESIELPPSDAEEFVHYYFAIIVSIVVLLTCALTITMIYTEILWVLLLLPVCLIRALDNYKKDHQLLD